MGYLSDSWNLNLLSFELPLVREFVQEKVLESETHYFDHISTVQDNWQQRPSEKEAIHDEPAIIDSKGLPHYGPLTPEAYLPAPTAQITKICRFILSGENI